MNNELEDKKDAIVKMKFHIKADRYKPATRHNSCHVLDALPRLIESWSINNPINRIIQILIAGQTIIYLSRSVDELISFQKVMDKLLSDSAPRMIGVIR